MLDKEFIEERKKDLLIQKEKLEKELSGLETKNNSDHKTKFPDYGNEPEDNELEVSNYEEDVDAEKNLNRMLADTNEALDKIEKGNYGNCENCNEEIDPARLKAYPQAKTCIKCENL